METLTELGARQIAARIQGYWASRGCNVVCRVEPSTIATTRCVHGEAFWLVRSDLGMELPPKLKAVA